MRRFFALILCVLVPSTLLAQEKKPIELTTKQIAEGWLSLFDGETAFGWKVDGEVKADKGKLVLGGTKPTKASVTTAFGHYHISVRFGVEGEGTVGYHIGESKGTSRAADDIEVKSTVEKSGSLASAITLDIPAKMRVTVQSALVQPLGMHALFNGKDLTGWKALDMKGKKSKYTITKEGWLNIKDGPGDLQTEKTFADFVLQLECISNGKHLNSGIFFRAIPGQTWQGYEAQIRNQFTDKPTQKYTIEEYDPKTNKLVDKKTIESTAFDYGTGAIYRRVPARKSAAKDGEWFTYTVVARGRHIATWVNGIQQVDWMDHRPMNENPRSGYRGAAGVISIQGHDPTTDLSFRNLRIAPLSGRE